MSSLKEAEAFWEKVCFDPNFHPEGRYQAYRDLVFEGMLDVMENLCPVIRGILKDRELKNLFWDFLREAPPKSNVLRELPWEVSQYLRRRYHPLLDKYPWLGELMEYEFLEIQVRFAEEEKVKVPPETLALNPAQALGEYTWPVHFIREERHDPKTLPRGQYYLLLWRDPQSLTVQFMEVNALVAALLKRLSSGPMARAPLIRAVAKEVGIPLSDEYLKEGQELTRSFVAQGILLEG